jgi:hypothetical protein
LNRRQLLTGAAAAALTLQHPASRPTMAGMTVATLQPPAVDFAAYAAFRSDLLRKLVEAYALPVEMNTAFELIMVDPWQSRVDQAVDSLQRDRCR